MAFNCVSLGASLVALSAKDSSCQCKRCQFDPWSWEDPTYYGAAKSMHHSS